MLNQIVLYVLQRLCEIPSKSISSDSSEDIDLDGISHKLIASVYSSEDIDLDGISHNPIVSVGGNWFCVRFRLSPCHQMKTRRQLVYVRFGRSQYLKMNTQRQIWIKFLHIWN